MKPAVLCDCLCGATKPGDETPPRLVPGSFRWTPPLLARRGDDLASLNSQCRRARLWSSGGAALLGRAVSRLERPGQLHFLSHVRGERRRIRNQSVGLRCRRGRRARRRLGGGACGTRGIGWRSGTIRQQECAWRLSSAVLSSRRPCRPRCPCGPRGTCCPLVALSAEAAGASFRQPVTVIFRSALESLLCVGAGVVCAVITAVARPTTAEHTPVQIVFSCRLRPLACNGQTANEEKLDVISTCTAQVAHVATIGARADRGDRRRIRSVIGAAARPRLRCDRIHVRVPVHAAFTIGDVGRIGESQSSLGFDRSSAIVARACRLHCLFDARFR